MEYALFPNVVPSYPYRAPHGERDYNSESNRGGLAFAGPSSFVVERASSHALRVSKRGTDVRTCFCVSIDQSRTWGSTIVVAIFMLLATNWFVWILRNSSTFSSFIVRVVQSVRGRSIESDLFRRVGHANGPVATIWASLRSSEGTLLARARMKVTDVQSFDVLTSSRAAENIVYRLPRGRAGGALRTDGAV